MNVRRTLADRYRLDERLGDGGMSVVWRAHDIVLDRRVAVKILANVPITRRAFRESIRVDARSAASLSHPHVASVFDYGEFTDERGQQVPFVVMELLRGRVLAERLREGPLDPPMALRVCAQVAGALAAAHACGIVHRDIKPGNVMLTPQGAKVFDFGIAASVGQLDDADPDTPILGTAAYLAPERLAGAPVTAASDVYALALLLFRALVNELPWPVQTVTEMIAAHTYVEPGPLPQVPGVPASVRELAQQCLAKEPRDRPSARDAAVVLADAAGISPALVDQDGDQPYGQSRPGGNGPDAAVPGARPRSPAQLRRASLRPLFGVATVVAILFAAILIPLASDGGDRNHPAFAATPSTGPSVSPDGSPVGNPVGDPAASGIGGQPAAAGSSVPAASSAQTAASAASATDPAGGPTGSPAANPVSAAPSLTLTSLGGSVVATCQGALAQLLSWTPEPGYRAQQVKPGPDKVASVVFHLASTKIKLAVTCVDGVPIATITPK